MVGPLAKLRPIAERALVSILGVLLALALLELGFSRFAIQGLPIGLHGFLPRAARVLAQTSKSGTLPRDYVAIVGDSYAEGLGDWFWEADPRSSPPFASQHVLHALTGRDVAVFGRSGNGSLGGLAGTPIGLHEQLRTLGLGLRPPRAILVYFYEGNDLDDNVRDLAERFHLYWDDRRLRDEAYFAEFIKRGVIDGGELGRERAALRWYDRLFFLRLVKSMLWRRLGRGEQPALLTPAPRLDGKINRALIGGRSAAIPDDLQGPSLELSSDKTGTGLYVFEQALRFLSRYFPESPVAVVYIPSPLSCYRLASRRVSVETYWTHDELQPASKIGPRSDLIAAGIAAAARRQGALFIDARPALRAAAALAAIHGPRDWKHFNRRGYTILAEAAAEGLSALDKRGEPGYH